MSAEAYAVSAVAGLVGAFCGAASSKIVTGKVSPKLTLALAGVFFFGGMIGHTAGVSVAEVEAMRAEGAFGGPNGTNFQPR